MASGRELTAYYISSCHPTKQKLSKGKGIEYELWLELL
jgi:hypothetical protein